MGGAAAFRGTLTKARRRKNLLRGQLLLVLHAGAVVVFHVRHLDDGNVPLEGAGAAAQMAQVAEELHAVLLAADGKTG